MFTHVRGFKGQITKQFKFRRSNNNRLTRVVEIGIMVVIIGCSVFKKWAFDQNRSCGRYSYREQCHGGSSSYGYNKIWSWIKPCQMLTDPYRSSALIHRNFFDPCRSWDVLSVP